MRTWQIKGFSTIEMLVAFAILSLAFTGILTVVFGNDNFAIDAQLNSEGLYYAERDLNIGRKDIQLDFENFAGFTSQGDDPRFQTEVAVEPISVCSKNLISTAAWDRPVLPSQRVTLTTIVTDILAAVEQGGNCSPFPPTNWDTPVAYGGITPGEFDGRGTGVAYANINGRRYAFLTTDGSQPNQNNLYAIDTTDFATSTGTGIDPDTDIFGVRIGDEGLNGIVTADINDNDYAFVLYNSTSSQLTVIDISDPSIDMPVIGSATIPNVSPGESAYPRSIYYRNEGSPTIYIGTDYLAFSTSTSNHELHVFEVSNPTIPDWDNSVDVDRNVNDIAVRDGFAYLATGPGANNTPMKIFDLASGSEVGSFSISSPRAGTALYLFEDAVYLGLQRTSSGNNFYRIDVTDEENPQQLGNPVDLGGNNTEVGDIAVQWPLAFIGIEGANSQHNFQVWNVTSTSAMTRIYHNDCTSGNPFPQNLSGLVFVDNMIFSSFRSNDAFKLIWDTAEICEE